MTGPAMICVTNAGDHADELLNEHQSILFTEASKQTVKSCAKHNSAELTGTSAVMNSGLSSADKHGTAPVRDRALRHISQSMQPRMGEAWQSCRKTSILCLKSLVKGGRKHRELSHFSRNMCLSRALAFSFLFAEGFQC